LTAAAAAAQPGDLVLFRPDRYRSTGVQLTRDGTADRPIVWRSSEPGQAILDGGGAETLIEARERRHWWFEGFTFTNAQRLLRVMRASDIVIRRNLFEVAGLGVTGQGAIHAESVGVLVLDNVFRGTTSWPRSKGIEPVYAVNLTGSGHIVAYNLIENVGDGAHIGNHGRLSASDYHNNDIIGATDDGLEIDHSDANVRVYRNRITNAFAGISGQPVFGGPVYVFRNVIFNTEYTPFKLHNDMAGMFIFHNTSVRRGVPFVIRASGDNVTAVTTRNNLFIGNAAPALQSSAGMVGCDFDGDGYAWGQGGFAEWNGRAYQSPLAAKEAGQLYARIGIVSLLPGRDLSAGLRPPADPKRRFTPADYDPRLIAGSRAVDRATLIANFNDGFAGSAPDLGCCELDQPLPHYGPRAPR
ncbi:MAG: hypothetical protein FJX67_14025, partial [Alphaproteobacteria bacterium]|nr:hypothetical protein [Alphaproteobacteria bacterium]